jgi:hypothetical protein
MTWGTYLLAGTRIGCNPTAVRCPLFMVADANRADGGKDQRNFLTLQFFLRAAFL